MGFIIILFKSFYVEYADYKVGRTKQTVDLVVPLPTK